MAKKMTGFNIKEAELAAALEITRKELDQIIKFFDSDPRDEWELRENDHFVYINKSLNERLFSEQGAYAIAAYMDAKTKKSFFAQLLEFITRHQERIRNAFISRKIQENCSSLTVRNNRHFLSKKDIVNILCTSPARLNQAFNDIQKSSPMTIYEDFEDVEGVRYYSFSGFYKLSQRLANDLKREDRRSWCAAIEMVGKKTFNLIIDAQTAQQKRVDSAKNAAKKRDKHCCQITNQTREKDNKISLVAHHLYSQEHYPHLAACRENLITLAQEIHSEFHAWNGGTKQPCTVDDLIRYVNQLYPDNYEVVLKLNQMKQMLDSQIDRKAA